MKIKNIGLSLFLVAAMLLSSCGSTATATPEPSATPTVLASVTPKPSATATPTTTPTETAAPTPTNQVDCTEDAEFVSDVTVPDDTIFKPGEKFLKTWRIRNTGTCTWNLRYKLVFLSGDQMSAPYSTPLTETPPQSTVDLSLEMLSPEQSGVFKGIYQFQNPAGGRFGVKDGNIWVRIVVSGETPTPASPTNTAAADVTPVSPTSGTPKVTPTGTPTLSPTQSGTSGSCNYTENPNFASQVFTLINAARATNGLPAFTLNSQLSAAALKHSIDMGCNNLLQHTGSDGSTPKSRVAAEGYSAASLQEAIYAQPPQYGGTPQAAVDWWLNDSVHRPVLLSSQLTEIGVGYVSVSTSALGGYFTLEVATP